MRSLLTHAQLVRLREHKYSSRGTSLTEGLMQHYWRWLITKVPLWVAPNLITFVGLIVNVGSSLLIILTDLNTEGKSPQWTYIATALGLFVYQSLDAIDGKQARRTNSNNPLGEIFDHGCDAISCFAICLTGLCAVGMQGHSYLMILFMAVVLELNFVYHWQTYVCGTLDFKTIDVTEGQFGQMAILLVGGILGPTVWESMVPVLGVTLREAVCMGTIFMCLVNMGLAFHIIVSQGVGKNGSTVADTSVLSPLFAILLQVPVMFYYAETSPSHLLEHHGVLFLSAFGLPIVKSVILMMMSGITKSPYPLFDVIMLGPLLACANLYLGQLLPEFYVVMAVLIYNIVDITTMCLSFCQEIATFLEVSVFSIPYPSKSTD